jgi:hypothetical protein
MLTVGIITFILGFLSMCLIGSIISWFVDPRILETNRNTLGLLYPVFTVDI